MAGGRRKDCRRLALVEHDLAAAVISATFAMFAVVLRRSQWQAAQLARTAELLKRLFGRYVSADVLRTLLEDPRRSTAWATAAR
jgi:hypothetical protein